MASMIGRRWLLSAAAIVGAAALACVAGAASFAAEQVSIEGAWSGGGHVVFPSGDKERASCKAHFRQHSANSYGMNAVCATPSARVAQTATLRRVSATEFSGSFHNDEYNVDGSIHISVRGGRLHASLNGGGASGVFSLGR